MLNDLLLVKKDESLTLSIPGELKEMVREYAEKRGVTMSTAVRMILVEFFSSDLLKSQV